MKEESVAHLWSEVHICCLWLSAARTTLILFGVSVLQENGMKMRETLAKQNIAFRWAVYFIALIFVLVFGVYGPAYNAADFIYGAY